MLAIQAAWISRSDKSRALQAALDAWNAFRSASALAEIPLVKAAMGAQIADFPPYVRPPFTAAPAEAAGRIRAAVLERLSALHTLLNAP
ncbi:MULTISPECIES: hypothetical protein [Methylomicrobium]|uniref:hypothetical protein n=1 Tax=Methylomicrobium TaxID=39773 RepID=UPI0002623F63|nr:MULTISPECIES: hypothetical protein [Methylomicrobium]